MKDFIWIDENGATASTTIKLAREYLWNNQSPKLRDETLARVQRLVAEQPQSWLAKHWKEVYR